MSTSFTQSADPNTSLGSIKSSLYRSNFNTNEASIPILRVETLDLIGESQSSSSYTLSSGNDSFIWRIIVDGTSGALSFDRDYSRDTTTDVVTSVPQFTMKYNTSKTYFELNGIMVQKGAINTINNAGNVTYTGAQIRDGVIVRIIDPNAVSVSDELPEASDIFDSTIFRNIVIGSYIDFSVLNASTTTGNVIINDSTGGTTTIHSSVTSTSADTIVPDQGNENDLPVRHYRVIVTSLSPLNAVVYEH